MNLWDLSPEAPLVDCWNGCLRTPTFPVQRALFQFDVLLCGRSVSGFRLSESSVYRTSRHVWLIPYV